MAIAKKLLIGALAFSAGYGTFRQNDGFPLVYNKITRDGSGVCFGLFNRVDAGVTFNGVVGGIVNINGGKINGAQLGLLNAAEGNVSSVNGVRVSLINTPEMEWADLAGAVRGVQVGLYNAQIDYNKSYAFSVGITSTRGSVQLPFAYQWPTSRAEDNQ